MLHLVRLFMYFVFPKGVCRLLKIICYAVCAFGIFFVFLLRYFERSWNPIVVAMCVTVLSAQIYHECETLCPVLCIWRQNPLLSALCRLTVGPFTTYSKCDASSKELAMFVQSCNGIWLRLLMFAQRTLCRHSHLTSPATVQCIRLVTILTELSWLPRKNVKQGRQCTYNVTLRRVRGTIVAVERQ